MEHVILERLGVFFSWKFRTNICVQALANTTVSMVIGEITTYIPHDSTQSIDILQYEPLICGRNSDLN